MDQRVKKLWIEALRSGEYKQGHDALRNDRNEFCCLGVLCSLYIDEHPEAVSQQDKTLYKPSGVLCSEVKEWSGLKDVIDLIYFNDNQRWDFNRLADYIEETV